MTTPNTSNGHLTQAKALDMLRGMLKLLQRARSTMSEAGLDQKVLKSIFPWVFDPDKCIVPALADLIGRAEKSGTLAPADFYNMMTVLYRFLPELTAVAPFTLDSVDLLPADPPDYMVYLRGWAPEERKA